MHLCSCVCMLLLCVCVFSRSLCVRVLQLLSSLRGAASLLGTSAFCC